MLASASLNAFSLDDRSLTICRYTSSRAADLVATSHYQPADASAVENMGLKPAVKLCIPSELYRSSHPSHFVSHQSALPDTLRVFD